MYDFFASLRLCVRPSCRPLLLAVLFCVFSLSSFGWGDDSHRAISRGAVPALPEEMRPFFLVNSEYIANHSLDPDYIPNRTQAQRSEHFLDIDEYGQPSFAELPHDLAEAKKKFGEETVVKRGLLPWTIQREFDRLVEAMKKKDWAETRLAAAHLSHFAADSTMPLHATVNYDGQLTRQKGVHLRFEVELVRRYHAAQMILPAPPGVSSLPGGPRSVVAAPPNPAAARSPAAGAPAGNAPLPAIDNPTEWAFDQIRRSHALVAPVLIAEQKAREAAPLDSEAYYAEFERLAGPILDARLRDAAAGVAGLWRAAWEKAGKPEKMPPENIVIAIVESAPQYAAVGFTAGHAMKTRTFENDDGSAATVRVGWAEPKAVLDAVVPRFDGYAICVEGGAKRYTKTSVEFSTPLPKLSVVQWQGDADKNYSFLNRTGDVKATTPAALRAMEQFPRCTHYLVYLWDDETPNPAMPEIIKLLAKNQTDPAAPRSKADTAAYSGAAAGAKTKTYFGIVNPGAISPEAERSAKEAGITIIKESDLKRTLAKLQEMLAKEFGTAAVPP